MTAVLKFIGYILLAFVLFIGLIEAVIWSGTPTVPETQRGVGLRTTLLQYIHQAKANKEIVVLDLDKLAKFDWDKVWVTTVDNLPDITAQTGHRYTLLPMDFSHSSWANLLYDPDCTSLLVFISNGKPVEHVTFPYDGHEEIELQLERQQPLSKEKAKLMAHYRLDPNGVSDDYWLSL